MTRNHIGVDLAKDFLEVCDPVRGRSRVANRPKAVAALGRRARGDGLRRLRGDERLRPAAPGGVGRGRASGGAGQSAARLALRALAQPGEDRPAGCGTPRRLRARAPARTRSRARPRPGGAARAGRAARPAAADGSAGEEPAFRLPRRGGAGAGGARRARGARPARALAREDRGGDPRRGRGRRDARPRRAALALDPGHRAGDGGDAARLPRRARPHRSPRRRLARRRGAAGARTRASIEASASSATAAGRCGARSTWRR